MDSVRNATTPNFPLPFPTWIVFLSRRIMRLRTQAIDDILKTELRQSWLGPVMSFAQAALGYRVKMHTFVQAALGYRVKVHTFPS